MMIEGLTHAHPEVSIELQLIEINRSDMVAYGLDLPTVIHYNPRDYAAFEVIAVWGEPAGLLR